MSESRTVRDTRGTITVPRGLSKWGFVHGVWDVESGRPERLGKGEPDDYATAYQVGRSEALAGRGRAHPQTSHETVSVGVVPERKWACDAKDE